MKTSFRFSAKDKNLLKAIYSFAKTKKAGLYLVGGILRDLVLGRQKQNPDFDFCIEKGAIAFGRRLAKKIKCGFVVLDKGRGACRLVKKIDGKTYTFDFTDFRGKSLKEDLLHRDFTMNAMALELQKALVENDLNNFLLDPFCAREDLRAKTIKVVNIKAFREDPLRILRAFSFACIFNFKIDKQTLRLISSGKSRLSNASNERVRDELFKILDSSSASDSLIILDKLRLLKIVFPEIENLRGVQQGPYHHLDVWQHSLEAVRQLEGLLQEVKNNKEIQDYLNEFICQERTHRALIKLGALLHDIGKPKALRHKNGRIIFHGHERIGLKITEEIANRLKLSNDEINSLRKMVLWHLRPGYLADIEELTARAKFRFFRDTNTEAIATLLLSIADQRATRGPLTTKGPRIRHEKIVFGLMKEYFKKSKEKKPPRLINGDDLIKKFKLEPSPLIGKILSEIEEGQAIGKIKTKPEALKAAAKIIREN